LKRRHQVKYRDLIRLKLPVQRRRHTDQSQRNLLHVRVGNRGMLLQINIKPPQTERHLVKHHLATKTNASLKLQGAKGIPYQSCSTQKIPASILTTPSILIRPTFISKGTLYQRNKVNIVGHMVPCRTERIQESSSS
jgi:hypothetical protein